MPDRVVLFIDAQNMYHCARKAFFQPDDHFCSGQFDPIALGNLIVSRAPAGFERVLHEVRIYTGRPESSKQPRAYGAHMRQCAVWERAGAIIVPRTLRYPPDWPASKAEEKGIDVQLSIDFVAAAIEGSYDVGIICSTDTDLRPAIEYVAGKFAQYPRPEVAAWRSPTANAALAIKGSKNIWNHRLTWADYQQIEDTTDYTRPSN